MLKVNSDGAVNQPFLKSKIVDLQPYIKTSPQTAGYSISVALCPPGDPYIRYW